MLIANGTRVAIDRTTPRHDTGVVLATDDKRAVLATFVVSPITRKARYHTFTRPLTDLHPIDEH